MQCITGRFLGNLTTDTFIFFQPYLPTFPSYSLQLHILFHHKGLFVDCLIPLLYMYDNMSKLPLIVLFSFVRSSTNDQQANVLKKVGSC